jgi:hypothetical protein
MGKTPVMVHKPQTLSKAAKLATIPFTLTSSYLAYSWGNEHIPDHPPSPSPHAHSTHCTLLQPLQEPTLCKHHALVLAVNLHALLQAIGNSSLAGGRRLGKGSRTTERPSGSTVADTDDADVVGTANTGIAGHALGHLNRDGEIRVCCQGQAAKAQSRDILGNRGRLEGIGIGTTRCTVNIS